MISLVASVYSFQLPENNPTLQLKTLQTNLIVYMFLSVFVSVSLLKVLLTNAITSANRNSLERYQHDLRATNKR
jgi:hypothetical protein